MNTERKKNTESQVVENDGKDLCIFKKYVYMGGGFLFFFYLVLVHIIQNFSLTLCLQNTNKGTVRYPSDTGRKRVVKW